MRSPAWALTWQVWSRQRWFWAATCLYVLTLAAVCQLVPVRDHLRFLVGFIGVTLLAYLAIFALGFLALVSTGDLERNSGFPSWMFTLPVTTRKMVASVMLNGTVGLVAAWLALVCLIFRPCGLDVPWSLALVAPSVLAWIQVLAWTPFTFPIVRLFLMVVILAVLGAVPFHSHHVPTSVVIVLQISVIAGAYPLACRGVARSRRGDGLESRWLPRWITLAVDALPRRRRPFASADAAQLWYEWRRNGTLFVQFAACQVALGWLLAVPGPFLFHVEDKPLFLIGYVLTAAPLMGMFVGSGMGKYDLRTANQQFPSFLAARPLATTAFVAAKLRMAALSALVGCALGILAALACLPAHGNADLILRLWHDCLASYPPYKAWTLLLLAPAILFLLTWKNLTAGMWVGLMGRWWVDIIVGMGWLILLALFGMAGTWFYFNPPYREYLWRALPSLAGLAILVKAAAAVWVVRVLRRHGMVRMSTLAWVVALWFAAVGSLYGLAQLFLPPGFATPSWLLVGCLFSVPFTDFALAPLALEWNRHR